MNWADWAILGILLVSSLISIKRGFVKEALSLVTWLVAFVVAVLFGDRLAVLLTDLMTGLSGTDRLFGMLFGLARGLVVVMALLILLPSIIPVDQDEWWRESALVPHFLAFEDWARALAAETTRFFFQWF